MAVEALLRIVRSMRMSGLGGILQGGRTDPKIYVLSWLKIWSVYGVSGERAHNPVERRGPGRRW